MAHRRPARSPGSGWTARLDPGAAGRQRSTRCSTGSRTSAARATPRRSPPRRPSGTGSPRSCTTRSASSLTVVLLGLKQARAAGAGRARRGARRCSARARATGLDDVRRVARAAAARRARGPRPAQRAGRAGHRLRRRTSGPRPAPASRPGLPALSAEAELVVYRVAQEALTNAARHADAATRRAVADSASATAVVLEVADDGRGFDPAADGAGLRGMRERAAAGRRPS